MADGQTMRMSESANRDAQFDRICRIYRMNGSSEKRQFTTETQEITKNIAFSVTAQPPWRRLQYCPWRKRRLGKAALLLPTHQEILDAPNLAVGFDKITIMNYNNFSRWLLSAVARNEVNCVDPLLRKCSAGREEVVWHVG